MQTMRYINLLDRVSGVRARKCFVYNGSIYFAVQSTMLPRALGQNGRNIRIISEQLDKRVRIIRDVSDDLSDIRRFIESIVSPIDFVSLEFKDGEYILTAGSRTRAATLIGRNKTRLDELNKIVEEYFGKSLKIV